MTVLWLLWASH